MGFDWFSCGQEKKRTFWTDLNFIPSLTEKSYGFLWIRICCGFALILLVWIEKDYSFSFWSVSDKSQFTLTKHDLTIMGKFFNLCALRKDVDFELLMAAATPKTVFFFGSPTLNWEGMILLVFGQFHIIPNLPCYHG